MTRIVTAYETCLSCNGSGLRLNDIGEPDTCRECGGNTVVRRRDERGRFAVAKQEDAPA